MVITSCSLISAASSDLLSKARIGWPPMPDQPFTPPLPARKLMDSVSETPAATQTRLAGLAILDNAGHTFGKRINGLDRCPACPGEHGGPGPCLHSRYTRSQRRFIFHPMHYPAYIAAHYNPDKTAAAHELARLAECRKDPPRGHMCWCVCPRESIDRAWPACSECRRHRANLKSSEPIAMGRTAHGEPPMPSVYGLDIALNGLCG